MAKIKVKLRPSRIEGRPGTIYYCISHKRMIRHITTDIHLLPSEWDEEKQTIKFRNENYYRIQNRINCDIDLLKRLIKELDESNRNYTSEEIVMLFQRPEKHMSIMSFFQEQIQFLKDCKRFGTAINYSRAATALSAYLDGRDMDFTEFTSIFIEKYGEYLLRKGMVRNSLSFHMRILRALFNKGVRRGYAEQSYPFRNVYTGIDRTKKRAVGESIISRLIKLDLEKMPTLSYARDLFLFSFYTRGMAFVDIAYLRKNDIQEGKIQYTRHKSGQELIIRIEPCIQEIINRYINNKTPYVFPILKNENQEECFRRYKNELRLYDSRLEKVSKILGLNNRLSSYTSRHTWATMARNQNVPLSIISAGMGHSSEKTTQIYLSSLENTLIDNANKGILESLTKSIS